MSVPQNLWDLLDSSFEKPTTETLDAGSVPPPYQKLLVHVQSMTMVLEAACREEILLRILHQQFAGSILFRRILLLRSSNGKPVEFGLARIHLQNLPPEVRGPVEEGRLPLGKLLRLKGVKYTNRPSAFFRIGSNGGIAETLQAPGPGELYGRHNRLLLPSAETLADVIEILAPFETE